MLCNLFGFPVLPSASAGIRSTNTTCDNVNRPCFKMSSGPAQFCSYSDWIRIGFAEDVCGGQKMKAAGSSETLVSTYQTTRRHVTEHNNVCVDVLFDLWQIICWISLVLRSALFWNITRRKPEIKVSLVVFKILQVVILRTDVPSYRHA
jgi:hypothetical protein